jgi:Ser/Thr protein kinase RdoA (MazF antagonist)
MMDDENRPAPLFPVVKSFLSEEALARRIEAAYDLREVRCQLLAVSMRDVYRVSAGGDRYICSIYRYNQRTPEQIEAEWDFVDHVGERGVPVAPAIRQESGARLLNFRAPEGIRYGVLATFVPGQHLRDRYNAEAARQYYSPCLRSPATSWTWVSRR